MNKEITILVNSCDSYEDLWEPFFKLFKIYWPQCNYRIILNTESKSYSIDGLNVETFSFYEPYEKVPYGKRILRHLKEIDSKYVLILIDDFFFNDFVDEKEILKCKQWLDNDTDIAAFFFACFNDKNNIKSDKYPGYEKRPCVGNYKISFQAALWRTTDFVESWKEHENPWSWEKYSTFRSFFSEKKYYSRVKEYPNPIDYGAKYGDAWNVVAGLWVVDSVDPIFKKNNIIIDYNKRGILKCKINELPRDHRRKNLNDLINEIKSIGINKWLKMKSWRILRAIKKVFGFKVEADYYEYLFNLLNKE